MADDNEDGQLIPGPWSGDSSYVPPPIASYADTIPPAPPETPEETTMELPVIPAAPDPRSALSSEGFPGAEDESETAEEGEEEAGEYVHRRSLADRLGDWIEHRISLTQSRREEEAVFRQAEIARKAAHLEARTKHELAMREHNHKLRLARAGKAGTGSGMGSDKGSKGPSGAGGSTGPRNSGGGGAGSRGSGGGRGGGSRGGSGGPGAGGSGRGPASGAKGDGKGGGKGSGRGSNGSSGAGGSAGPSGGSKGRQNGSGGSGASGGGGKGGGAGQGSPTSLRQDRKANRQAARQERLGARQNAGLADRSKGRDQKRQNKQAGRDERRAAKAERDAARKAKRDAAAADGTTLGSAVAKEAERRWDKRRKDAKAQDKADRKAKRDRREKAKAEKDAGRRPDEEKVNLRKDQDADDKGAAGPEAGASDADHEGPKAKPKPKRKRRRARSGKTSGNPRGKKTSPGAGRSGGRARDPFDEPVHTVFYDWPGHESRPPNGTAGEPNALGTGPLGLPAAPEQHADRPGTSRPNPTTPSAPSEGSDTSTKENDMAKAPAAGQPQQNLAREHRTDITLDEYLMEMANIAVGADFHKAQSADLADALTTVADALRDMAVDLVGDHNIDTQVTTLISDLADAAGRMKTAAARCAEDCATAAEAAFLVADDVRRVYSQDTQAMNDAGLVTASAAAHHD